VRRFEVHELLGHLRKLAGSWRMAARFFDCCWHNDDSLLIYESFFHVNLLIDWDGKADHEIHGHPPAFLPSKLASLADHLRIEHVDCAYPGWALVPEYPEHVPCGFEAEPDEGCLNCLRAGFPCLAAWNKVLRVTF